MEAHHRARRALVAEEREWRTNELIDSMREVAGRGARELVRRLDEEPESIATRLSVAVGIALDKIAKHERWDEEGSRERGVTPQVAELLNALGTRASIAAHIRVEIGDAQSNPGDSELLQLPSSGCIDVAARTHGGGWTDQVQRAIDETDIPSR